MNKKSSSLLRSGLIAAFALATSTLCAETFTVTRFYATGPGSLPVMLNQANAAAGDNVIQFAITNPIILASPLSLITNNITIIGRTDVQTVIDGGGTNAIFAFASGTTSVLSGLVIQNSGAALDANGDLVGAGTGTASDHHRTGRADSPRGSLFRFS